MQDTALRRGGVKLETGRVIRRRVKRLQAHLKDANVHELHTCYGCT